MSFGLIELALVFGAALAIGLWELLNIRREVRRDRKGAESERAEIHSRHDTECD